MFRFAALLACLALAVAAEGAAPRSLKVGLHADWTPTGAAAEAAAWIATTAGNATAWSFLSALSESSMEAKHLSEAEDYCRVKAAAEKVLSSRASATLQWALSARIMSPRIAAQVASGDELLARFPERKGLPPDAFAAVVNTAAGTVQLILLGEDGSKSKVTLKLSDANYAASLARTQPADHTILAQCSTPTSIFILYADAASSSFATWYSVVTAGLAENTRQVLRHWSARDRPVTPVALQGYAVEVAVKSTEYRVVDDRVFTQRLFPDAAYGAPEDAPPFPVAIDGELGLDAYKQPFVGLAAADSIRSAAAEGGVQAAVKMLRTLAEDGPVALADAVKDTEIDGEAARAAGKLADNVRARIGAGDVIFVNGRPLSVTQAVAQGLPSTLQCLASVSNAAGALQKAGAGGESVAALLHRDGGGGAAIDLRVELVGPDSDHIVTWYNDLTKDKRYRSWDAFENSTAGFARYAEKVGESREKATSPGDFKALVKVRANLLSLVIALDPGDPRQLGFLSLPEQIVRGDLPLRAGIILVPNNEVSTLVTAGFHYLRLGRGKKAAVSFIATMQNILEYVGGMQGNAELSPKIVELAFNQVAREGEYSSLAAVVNGHSEVKTLLQNARKWAQSMGLFGDGADSEAESKDEAEKTFSMVSTINGILLKDVVGDTLPVALKEQHRIAELLQAENNTANLDPADWTKHDPSLLIVKRVSKSLLSNEPADILSGTGSVTERLALSQLLDHKEEWSKLEHVAPETDEGSKPTGAVTLWLASCRHSSELYNATKARLEEFVKRPFVRRSNVRVGYLSEESHLSDEITKCDIKEEKASDVRYVINGRILLASEVGSTEDLEAEIAAEYLSAASKFGANQAPVLNPWDAALLALAATVDVDAACSSSSGRGQQSIRDDALASVLSLTTEGNPDPYVFPSKDEISAAAKAHPLSIVAVSDPLGPFAAATSSFLTALSEAFADDDIFVGLALVPSTGVRNEVPKSRQVFSRFLLAPRAEFSNSGKLLPARASFDRLPQKSILTVDVKQPRPWFIASFSANYDMDNVILSSLPERVPALHAQYVLKSLLVEGSCIDENAEPPQGLQLELSRDGLPSVDTLVMGNLGYFQLRVPLPGQWGLSLASGRSSEVFEIESVDSRLGAMYGAAGAGAHTFTADTSGGIHVFVDSLNGACGTLLRVKRKAGYEGENVLDLEGSAKRRNAPIARAKEAVQKMGSIVSGVFQKTSVFAGGQKSKEQEKIHVFSVASGHLYERFLKIMMLSVSKHAKRPVKFWLLENYLSPSFKKLLPHFSEMHGFEVGMVTYRWPGWLREQSEKQRIIWAYKILYLDVLFPLKVRRIIFVDADQVVRSDLSELMDIDLQGAPYGYVPFCDSREEVDGYRFWKTGFWESTLRGKKYHISALYVVDLETLRGTASGDKLRAMYQSLSADPNSLSNLDQDLPNYAAAVPGQTGNNVPIFGLPQEWLWCESWCDDKSKKTAKTIDLCNNPMTKEPKLVSAKRIIAEWTDLDDEATNATETIYALLAHGDKNTVSESVATEDTTVPEETNVSEEKTTSEEQKSSEEKTASEETEKQEL